MDKKTNFYTLDKIVGISTVGILMTVGALTSIKEIHLYTEKLGLGAQAHISNLGSGIVTEYISNSISSAIEYGIPTLAGIIGLGLVGATVHSFNQFYHKKEQKEMKFN